MSLSVQISQKLGAFALDAEFGSDGPVTALYGPSGSGKTSVIRAIAGLNTPDTGRIINGERILFDTVRGINLPVHQRRLGIVFQEPRLFPHLTISANLLYGLRFSDDSPELEPVVELLDLAPLLKRRPQKLSGGEAQRVAIGRALLSGPELLIMDEPLSSLDPARKAEILPYLERLKTEAKIGILYVSHQMSEIARLADTLVLIRDGHVMRVGEISTLLSDPSLVPELGLQEAGAILEARVTEPDAGDGLSALAISGGTLLLPRLPLSHGARLRVRIKASDVMIARSPPQDLSALNILPATVAQVHEGTGPGVAVALRCGQEVLMARITRRSARTLALSPGVACYAVIKSVGVAPADIGALRQE